jgi:hypothetical protein
MIQVSSEFYPRVTCFLRPPVTMAVTRRRKGKAASPQNTSTGLKLRIGPQRKKSVLETLDELDMIGRGSAEDESDSDDDDDKSQEDDEEEDEDEGDQENGEDGDEGVGEEDDEVVLLTPKSLKRKRTSKKSKGADSTCHSAL